MILKQQIIEEQLIDKFFQLVRISSYTGHVDEFRNFLKNQLESFGLVGGQDEFGNLVFKTKKFNAEKSLLLTTHIDTVQPGESIDPVIDGDFIKSKGETILAADPKSGIASILIALEYFSQQKKELRNLEFIFSTNEEEGEHTLELAQISSKKALVLDNADLIERVVYKSPFAQVFEINVKGHEVYAQIDKQGKGKNAILALSYIVQKLPWAFYKDGCVANTGIMNGGRATTLIPAESFLKGNIYCFEERDLVEYIEQIKYFAQKADERYGTQTLVNIVEKYKGSCTDASSELACALKNVYKKNQIDIDFIAELLVNSNNCLGYKGIESLNLGQGYKDCHTVNERLDIEQFKKFTSILIDLISLQ